MGYQEPKAKDYGINNCDGCLEKQRIIDRQGEEITRLKQKIAQNQRTGTEGFFGSSTPSSQIPVKSNSLVENQAKKGGGQPGHRGVGRQIFAAAQADEQRVARVEAENCSTCECQLNAHSSNQRAIYELERERVRKVQYIIERKKCPNCRKIVSGKIRNAFSRVSMSNELVLEVAEQHYLLGRSLGQIARRFSLSYATLVESLRRIGQKLKPSLEELKAHFRASEVKQADETLWRTDGGNGYAWYFGAPKVSLYLFRQTRSASVVREVCGKEPLPGVLVVDQYSGYNRVPCSIQYCYAHLLRKQEDLAKEFPANEEIRVYTSQMSKWLSAAMKLRKEGLSPAKYQQKAARIKERILKLSDREAKHPGVRRCQDFYVEKADRLYQWCRSAEIPAENNYAEREIRKIVMARKISHGSQSETGAETREIWTSVLESLKKREANPRAKLVEALNKLSADENFDIAEYLFGNSKSKPD